MRITHGEKCSSFCLAWTCSGKRLRNHSFRVSVCMYVRPSVCMYVTFWLKFWKNGLQSKRCIQLESNLGHRWIMKSRSCWRGQRSPGEVKGHLRSNCIICSKCLFPSQTFTNWNQTWVIDESRKAAHNDEVKGHLPRSKVNLGEAVKYVPNVHFFPQNF